MNQDVKRMAEFYRSLGFQKIYVTTDPTYDHIKKFWSGTIEKEILSAAHTMFRNATKELKKDESERDLSIIQKMRKPLLSVYYTGHGVHDAAKGKMSIILNEVEPKNRYFPLMTNLESNASKKANSFIMAAFDCCRDLLKQTPKRSLSPLKEEGHNLFIVYG
jgi:hypothetical protein